MQPEIITRRCKKCETEKPLERFQRHSQCNGGRLPICSDCKYQAYKNSAAFERKRQARDASVTARKSERIAAHAIARQEKDAAILAAGKKACKKCEQIKDLTEFPSHPSCVGGRSGVCHACRYQARKPHLVAEKERARAKRWRLAHPERDRELRRAQSVRYRARKRS